MEPEQWLADYDKRLTEIAARAREAGEKIRRAGASATSPRGEVTVRVSASGTLEDLRLTPAARTLESDDLARLILDTTATARHAVGRQLATISTGYLGEGPALDALKQYLPAGAPARRRRDDDDYFANPEITQ